MMHGHGRDLRHVACAVYVRMARYYDTHRKSGIIASLFGEETAMPYTMFGSAVFFAPERHADCEYRLDPIHTYRCQNGFWECTRIHGSRQKSSKLGEMMRACDQRLRVALGSRHLLKEEDIPKYLAKIIDEEIAAWLSWSEAHRPVEIDIDLSRLGAIRDAAAETREALLIDEEREGGDAGVPGSPEPVHPPEPSTVPDVATKTPAPAATPAEAGPAHSGTVPGIGFTAPAPAAMPPVPPSTVPAPDDDPTLTPPQRSYLIALLDDDAAGAASALKAAGTSEDMLVDAVNEALFDLVGDTVLEFGAQGPQIIEDYEEDVRGFIDHD